MERKKDEFFLKFITYAIYEKKTILVKIIILRDYVRYRIIPPKGCQFYTSKYRYL